MRNVIIALVLLATSPALASAAISLQEADARVRADGYGLIARTEAENNTWDVWASKDGVAYEVKVDAHTGALVDRIALDADD